MDFFVFLAQNLFECALRSRVSRFCYYATILPLVKGCSASLRNFFALRKNFALDFLRQNRGIVFLARNSFGSAKRRLCPCGIVHSGSPCFFYAPRMSFSARMSCHERTAECQGLAFFAKRKKCEAKRSTLDTPCVCGIIIAREALGERNNAL